MFIEVEYTKPTVIKSIDDYKDRVEEILFWQIKDTVLVKILPFAEIFKSKTFEDLFWCLILIIFSVLGLPFSVAYICLSLVELLVNTILLPLYLIPLVRIIPTTVWVIIWACEFTVGIFGGALSRI